MSRYLTLGAQIPESFETFKKAFRACKYSAELVLFKQSCKRFGSSDLVLSGSDLQAKEVWASSRCYCVDRWAVNISDISAIPGCAVLVNFRGMWNQRGKFAPFSNTTLLRSKFRAAAIKEMMRHKRAWWDSSPLLGPSISYVGRAMTCARQVIWISSFDALHVRWEAVRLGYERTHQQQQYSEFAISCIKNMTSTWPIANRTIPLFLATDFNEAGAGSKTNSDRNNGFVASALAAGLSGLGRPIFKRFSCKPSCSGTDCFFLDAAMIMMADQVLQIPGGGGSGGHILKLRIEAGKSENTTIVQCKAN